ncbi:MAG TPA: hypothetical protein VFZ04_01580, partial [Longimicrobiales bacterium]
MESPIAKPSNGSDRRRAPEAPVAARPGSASKPARRAPFLRLFAFYAVLVGIAMALVYYVPAVRDAWSGEALAATQTSEALTGRSIAPAPPDRRMLDRTMIMVLITLSALALSLPVAWIYTYTRRLRYDPSLVHSVIILPMVVAGIVVIV